MSLLGVERLVLVYCFVTVGAEDGQWREREAGRPWKVTAWVRETYR